VTLDMYEYGNARVAALRGRLLDATALRRMAEVGSPAEVLAALDRQADWRPILRETAPLVAEPQAAVVTAIERHRSVRLGHLVRWYDGEARRLVEALVMGFDAACVAAILRRRRGGSAAGAIGASIAGGALLDAATLGALGRSVPGDLGRLLSHSGLVEAGDARTIATGLTAGRDQRWVEDRLMDAVWRARTERAKGRSEGARLVRAILHEERSERSDIEAELEDAGPGSAWLLERTATLDRLDRTARLGPRDPLGVGAVAGYVAALEAQGIRMRASLARVAAGWSPEAIRPFLSTVGT